MGELERVVYLILKNLLAEWLSRAPERTQKVVLLWLSFILSLAALLFVLWTLAKILPRIVGPAIGVLTRFDQKLRTTASMSRHHVALHKSFRIPLLICVVFLLVAALGRFPYDFYVLLRVAVSFSCAIEFMAFREREYHVWSGAFALTALVYNPFLPLHLHRSTWVITNWATLLFFGFAIGAIKPDGDNESNQNSSSKPGVKSS